MAVVSSPVLDVLRTARFRTFFKTVITGKAIQFVGFSFVDDTDQIQTSRYPGETAISIAEQMQLAVDEWEGGIWASGGALDSDKSHWYLIDFLWKNGKWRLARENDTLAELRIRDSITGHKVVIDRLEVNEARTTLGVNQCPSGSMMPQVERM